VYKSNQKSVLIWWFCFLLAAMPVFAVDVEGTDNEEPVEDVVADNPDPATATEDEESFIDESQKKISKSLIDISHRVDSIFSSERMMEESPGSYACLSLNTFLQELVENDYYVDYCVKVDLPGTKKRWKFVLSSNENDEDGQQTPGTPTAPPLPNEDTSGLAGLRYIAEKSILRNIHFDVGVKTSTPLNPYTRARFRKTWLPDPWLFRLTEQLYWFNDTGAGLLSRFDIERKLSEKWFGRSTSEADYKERIDEWYLSQTFGVYRKVAKRQALNLEWQIIATDADNTKVNYYIYRLRWRINFWREWLFVEASPQILYDRERDFRSSLGLYLSVEAMFGNF
jgi:hypothetical protein